MSDVRPFRCIRPKKEAAAQVAALPYDVYSRQEAKHLVELNPLSFLAIDRAETQFEEEIDLYDRKVYEKARQTLEDRLADGTFVADLTECYYLYELTMNGRVQTGIVACASIDDYRRGIIKCHEKTRESKELDRINHVNVTDAQTGPIFLTYRRDEMLDKLVALLQGSEPVYDFRSDDQVRHRVWKIKDAGTIDRIQERFASISSIYIADGHHRAASAVKVGMERRTEHSDGTGSEPFQHFLSVLFPDDQLSILPYHRVVKDLNGWTKEEFLQKLNATMTVEEWKQTPYQPLERHSFGMYLDGEWYALRLHPELAVEDLVEGLDVSLLQDHILAPILGIDDPRTDSRIDFVGGIRGLEELRRQVDQHMMTVAFALHPTSIPELFAVADAGLLMPPKSTWFEPKLRSGLFIHRLI